MSLASKASRQFNSRPEEAVSKVYQLNSVGRECSIEPLCKLILAPASYTGGCKDMASLLGIASINKAIHLLTLETPLAYSYTCTQLFRLS